MSWNITDCRELEDAIFGLKLRLAREIGVCRGMTVVDMGCGQGGFTDSVAKTVREGGRVLAVDVSDEYLTEFEEHLAKYGVKSLVTFIQADASVLEGVIPDEVADMVVSYRFLEELIQPEAMATIVRQMAQIVKRAGKVCIIELSAETRNEAEETYVRLHRESGDSFFEPEVIMEAMEATGLKRVSVEKFKTDIWFSPKVAKQDLEFAQVWFDAEVEKNLGQLIDKYGMKYPPLLIFSGVKE